MAQCIVKAYVSSNTWYKSEKLYAIDVLVRGGGGGGASGVANATTNQRYGGAGGGGGGCVRTQRRIPAASLPESVPVYIGVGGWGGTGGAGSGGWHPGANGEDSYFGDILRGEGGGGASHPFTAGKGGLSVLRGGNGAAQGLNGESVSHGVISLLSGGGGGGAGAGYTQGGVLIPADSSHNQGGSVSSVPLSAFSGGGLGQNGKSYVTGTGLWVVLGSGTGGGGGTYSGSGVGGTGGAGGYPGGGGGGGGGGTTGGGAGGNGANGSVVIIEYLYDE
jgi:hypothetical protein